MRRQSAVFSAFALIAGFSMHSATAADLGLKEPSVAVPSVHWDGLYASFSAGGTWTNAKSSEFDDAIDSISVTTVPPGFFGALPDTVTGPYKYADNLSGKQMGAVFTFTMGYNVVWSRWVAGIQSEVSYNKNDIRLNGTGASQLITFPASVNVVTALNNSTTSDVFARLSNNWTISEMARVGYLVAPDWQVYALVGWSWGGFNLDGYSAAAATLGAGGNSPLFALPAFPAIGAVLAPNGRNDVASVVLSGFTYGAGVEKDFGWLRAFVQYKGIDYGSKSVATPINSASTTNWNVTNGVSASFAETIRGTAARAFKADVNQVTAGVTIPINWRNW